MINASPTSPQDWAEKVAENRSYWNMSDEEYADVVAEVLYEQYPKLSYDTISDLIHSSLQSRRELKEGT